MLRFWWVVLIGVMLASLIAVLAVYRVDFGVPPKLVARSEQTYTTGARVLVTSLDKPYYRTSVERPSRTSRPRRAPTSP